MPIRMIFTSMDMLCYSALVHEFMNQCTMTLKMKSKFEKSKENGIYDIVYDIAPHYSME